MARDQKREAIIDAAQKRFNHFGVGKTTMNEIADDLSISKASLYYYFPDKLNLFAAVLQKIINSEDVEKTKEYAKEKDPLAALLKYLDNRTEFIIQHYNILEYLKHLGVGVPKELQPVFDAARSREKTRIASIITQGVKEEKIKVEDPNKMAELLHDCLDGLRISIISQKTNFFPDKKQFYDLAKREKEVAAIFIKALRS